MAGLHFAVVFGCVHILMCAPVHNGENQHEMPNKLLNNTLAIRNETVTSCESKLKEAYIQLANYKTQKVDLQTWMNQISQAIVDQQQLMTKLHIDIDSFLGWAHGPNGTLQFALINESLVSNETDGPDDVDIWDEDFSLSRRAGWLTQQNMMTEGEMKPESPSEPNPGLVEPLEVVDYEEEGGLSVQTEYEEEEPTDNEKDPGETVVSKEITEAAEKPQPPRKAEVTEKANSNAQGITKTVPGTTVSQQSDSSKPTATHHKIGNKKPNEEEELESENEPLETEKEAPELEKEPGKTDNEELETENEPQEKENEPQETDLHEKENEPKENEPNQKDQEEKDAETGQGEVGKEEALLIDEEPLEHTGRSANSKLGRRLLGLEMSNTKSKGHGTVHESKAKHTVYDLRNQIDACLRVVTHREGFNKLHGMERYYEQNNASQKLKVLECVLNVIKGMPVTRQNIVMSRLQRLLETMKHWGQ